MIRNFGGFRGSKKKTEKKNPVYSSRINVKGEGLLKERL